MPDNYSTDRPDFTSPISDKLNELPVKMIHFVLNDLRREAQKRPLLGMELLV